MTGPRTALALAHRRVVCGIDARADRLDREDLEAADNLARLLADQGYEITKKGAVR
jgi:hypothetical protein